LVMDYPDEAERSLPLILHLVNDEKSGWQRGETVYLADQINKGGSNRLNIVRGIPLAEIRINPADFFLRMK
jgi:hypothetical protein